MILDMGPVKNDVCTKIHGQKTNILVQAGTKSQSLCLRSFSHYITEPDCVLFFVLYNLNVTVPHLQMEASIAIKHHILQVLQELAVKQIKLKKKSFTWTFLCYSFTHKITHLEKK